jgi:UDP-GlcNAc3NAcA epimerase
MGQREFKIVTVLGARPQFIKASALSRLARQSDRFSEVIVHTGQHYDENMSDVFFRELEIDAPRHQLMTGGQGHGAMTGRQIEGVESILMAERPDAVLVYGDTNSTLAGAIAASKLHIPIAHVEAGLRSYNRRMPEEINRVLTDHISEWLFTPTAAGGKSLATEGVDARQVFNVGDVMFDVALFFADKARRESAILDRLGLSERAYCVATVHRAENTDDPERLQAILAALTRLGRDLPVVLPLHPRTRAVIARMGIVPEAGGALRLIDPVGYLDMTRLLQGARVVATDSGGLQKEAFFHKAPCVTLRDETEWVELIELGWNRIPRSLDAAGIDAAIGEALASSPAPDAMPYGDGNAAGAIIDVLLRGRVTGPSGVIGTAA